MSEIQDMDITRHAGNSEAARGRVAWLNGTAAVIIVAVVALSVVPFASNRPFFWAFWPAVLGLVAFCYGLILLMTKGTLRTPFRAIRIQALLFGAVCLILVVQMAPLGPFYWGAGLLTQNGVMLQPPSISTTPGETLLMLLRWFGFGLLFFLGAEVARNGNRRLLMLNAVMIVVTAHAAVGILSYYQWGNTILGIPKWAYLDSVTGTFVNRNSFATFLAFGLTVATGLIAHALRYEANVSQRFTLICGYFVCIIFMMGAVLGTESRAGLLVSVLGPLVVLMTHAVKGGDGRRRALGGVAILILLLAVVASLLMFGSGIWARLMTLDRSGAARFDLYAQVWHKILQAPLLGYGGGSFRLAYQAFHQPPVDIEFVWSRAHNTYITLWFELGIVGGTLAMLLIGSITKAALSNLREAEVDPANAIWIGIVAVAGVHSLFDFSLEMFAVGLLFSLLAALTVAARPLQKRPG